MADVDFTYDDELNIRIGGETYLLRMDFSSVLHARVQRWFASQLAEDADEDRVEQEGIAITMKALGVERAVAAAFKPMERKNLLAFLSVGPYPNTRPIKTSQNGRSGSSAGSAAASVSVS